jgi:membrane fusion protein (multidrug efflux system)
MAALAFFFLSASFLATDALAIDALAIDVVTSAIPVQDANREVYRARAMIKAIHQPVISSQVSGLIKKITVREGDYFKKGKLLVAFDNSLVRAQQDKTAAELEASRASLENKLKLEKLGSIGALAVSVAKAEVKSRRAEKKMADITLARCSIKAPFNGRVVSLFVNEHESVSSNQKLLEIVSSDQLEIEIMAPSKWLPWLKTGVPFQMEFDQAIVSGTIISVGAVVDPVSKMVKARGRFRKSIRALLPGMTTTVNFPIE